MIGQIYWSDAECNCILIKEESVLISQNTWFDVYLMNVVNKTLDPFRCNKLDSIPISY